MIDEGANVNAADNDYLSALMVASTVGHLEVVKVLTEEGADINALDREGFTALMYASFNGHAEVVKLFIEAGANTYAKETGRTRTVDMLTRAGAEE